MSVESKGQLEVFKLPVVNICSISFKMLNEFLFSAGLLSPKHVQILLLSVTKSKHNVNKRFRDRFAK